SEDALSMAFSLGSRLPFLDHRIVEFCFSLPYSDKIGEGWTKLLLRQATAGLLPEGVRWRRARDWTPSDRCCSIKSRWSAVGSIAAGSSAAWAVSELRPRNGCEVTCFRSGIC